MLSFTLTRSNRLGSILSAATAVLCAACGNDTSGGGSGGPPPPGDTQAPLALIQTPPDGCLTDAPTVRLTIAVTDETGIDSVRVGGTPAVFDIDGLWKVTVPLIQGDNTLLVETRDTLNNLRTNAARLTIRREQSLWIEPSAVTFDAVLGEAMVLDPAVPAIFGVDPVSGVRTQRSGGGVGSGPAFQAPRDLVHVASIDFVAVTEQDSVLLVNPATGTRTTLSGPSVGGGLPLSDVRGIADDPVRNRVLVVDDARSELIGIDLSTGARTTVSSDTVGTGPSLAGPRGVAVDVARNRALVTVALARAIVAVDLGNGNRTFLSGSTAGSGPDFVRPFGVAVDVFQDRAVVTDPGTAALLAVDLATGDRAILSSSTVGSGTAFLVPTGISFHLGNVPLVTDSARDALFEVGTQSGDRVIVSGPTQGVGPQLERPAALTDGLTFPERLAVADRNALFSVVVATGERAVVSGAARGSGQLFLDLIDVAAASGSSPCITVLDGGARAILRVDRNTGDRTVVSDDSVGAGPTFLAPRRLALEFNTTNSGCSSSAIVVDRVTGQPTVLLRVDLLSGNRSVLSDETHGVGPLVVDPVGLEVNHASGSIFVLDGDQDRLIEVDPVSGDRTQFQAFSESLAGATDIALDFSRNRILVTDASLPGVRNGNLQLGTVSTLSGPTVGLGPSFGIPAGIELAFPSSLPGTPATPIAFVLDTSRGCVMAVDTRAGQRVIRSK